MEDEGELGKDLLQQVHVERHLARGGDRRTRHQPQQGAPLGSVWSRAAQQHNCKDWIERGDEDGVVAPAVGNGRGEEEVYGE